MGPNFLILNNVENLLNLYISLVSQQFECVPTDS